MASDDATIRLCGPCRHFELALLGPHGCQLGLEVLDGVQRVACASFDPFTPGEGSMMDQADCCAHAAAADHKH